MPVSVKIGSFITERCCARCLSIRLSVCLSVCPLHAGIVWKRLSIKVFHHRVATPFSLFHTKRYSEGTRNWCVECGGYQKIAIFDQYLANRKPYPGFRMAPSSMTLNHSWCHYLTPNILETVRDTDIVTMEY